ncbi:MAG: glycosyltransferase family 1 protein, partial [Candidatus Magasanikbacteria bacterium]|nr:glycosyltransferase family 1 protein [Candidatus Magasanikbacteria bacterium]
MIIIDGRTLSEPQPTGVTEVARQCIEHITSAFPNTKIVQASEHLSNSFTNFLLYSRLTTLEDIAHAPRDPKNIIFLPNTHFIHTRVEGARIQVVHDLSFLHAPQWYSPRMRAWHHATRAIESLHRADLLISVSEWTRQDLITHAKIPADRVVVVPPAAPEPHGGTRPQKLSFHDKPFFLFLGTLEKRKNIRGVIEAFELIKNIPELKNYQLVLAGRLGFGAPNTNKLPERVHHLSYISDSEKWWLLKHATALVYPSFFEG